MGEIGRSEKLETRRRRLRKLAIATSVAAAIVLSLSAAAAATAARSDPTSPLVLEQLLNGVTKCVSPIATCTVVNLYGQDGNPGISLIAPGQQHRTTVELRNAGTLAASSFTMLAGPCRNQRPRSGGRSLADLCSTLTVAVACTTGSTTFAYGPATLTAFGQSGTHTISSSLAARASSRCTFTVTDPATASPSAVTRAVQAVTWTLTAKTAPPTTTPPTTTPPSVATTSPPSTAVPPPSVAAPPPPSTPFTGTNALTLAIAGLVLLAVGGVLFLLSRRRDHAFGPLTGGDPDHAKP